MGKPKYGDATSKAVFSVNMRLLVLYCAEGFITASLEIEPPGALISFFTTGRRRRIRSILTIALSGAGALVPAAARASGIYVRSSGVVGVYSSGSVVIISGGGGGAVTGLASCEDIVAPPGDETDWSATGSGDWFDAGNWSDGVPGSATTITAIKSGGTATIYSAAANAGASLDVCSGTVDLQTDASLVTGGILIGEGGTLHLSGSTAVSGQITLDGGTLRSDISGSLSNLFELTETTTSTVSVAADKTLTLTGAFPSLGADAKIIFGSATDTGTIVFSPSNVPAPSAVAPAGDIEIAGGTLKVANSALGTLYIASITVDAGATLDLNDQEPPTGNIVIDLLGSGNVVTSSNAMTTTLLTLGAAKFSGSISGTGRLDIEPVCFSASGFCTTGIAELSGTNTFTGTTTITNGTLLVDSSGAITGTSNAIINADGNLTINGIFSGRGVSINSGGAMTINGSATTGITVGSGGTLAVESGGTLDGGLVVYGTANISGSVAAQFQGIEVESGGRLTVDGSTNTQGLEVRGNGIVTINGSVTSSVGIVVDNTSMMLVSSGGSISAPSDILVAGTLKVDGTVTSTNGLTVYADGTVTGTGTIASTHITSGGILAPGGNGIGTLHVNGSLSIAGGGVYEAEISSNNSDKVTVTGAANIAGILNLELVSAPVVGTRYTLLTATGGITGKFAAFDPTPLGEFRPTLTYDANDVMLEYELSTLSPNLSDSATANETAVVTAIDASIDPGTPLPDAFQALANLSPNALASTATQLSGELPAALPQVEATAVDPFLGLLLDQSGGRGMDFGEANHGGFALRSAMEANERNGVARLIPERRLQWRGGRTRTISVWISGYGEHDSVSGDISGDGSHAINASTIGTAAGTDVRVMPGLIAGAAFGYGHSTFSLADNLGSGTSNDLQFGIHAQGQLGRSAYLSAGGVYALQDVATHRTITSPAAATLNAKFTAHDLAGRVEGGYRLRLSSASAFTPYLAAQWASLNTPGYSETGSADYALAYDANNASNSRVELGAAMDDVMRISYNTDLYLYGRAAFAHAFQSNQDAHAAFVSLPGSDFTVHGAVPDANLALLAFDAEFEGRDGFALGIKLDGSLSQNSQSYFGTADMSYTW